MSALYKKVKKYYDMGLYNDKMVADFVKKGKLTPEEYEDMKKHSIYGCELLENFKQEESEF